jgi:hypothetical protein
MKAQRTVRLLAAAAIFAVMIGWGEPGEAAVPPECAPITATGNRPGLNGTTHDMAIGSAFFALDEWFESSYDNWQYVQIDLGCVRRIHAVNRHMSRNGDTSGTRSYQGEAISYSVDGVTWQQFTASNTTGWESYVNYVPHAWHSVEYGWSEWLEPVTDDVPARYVRYSWDGDHDRLEHVGVSWQLRAAPSCTTGAFLFECDLNLYGGFPPYEASGWGTHPNAVIDGMSADGTRVWGRCHPDGAGILFHNVDIRDRGGSDRPRSVWFTCSGEGVIS